MFLISRIKKCYFSYLKAASRVIFALKDLITPDSKSSGALQLSQTILDAEKSVKEFSEAANKVI